MSTKVGRARVDRYLSVYRNDPVGIPYLATSDCSSSQQTSNRLEPSPLTLLTRQHPNPSAGLHYPRWIIPLLPNMGRIDPRKE